MDVLRQIVHLVLWLFWVLLLARLVLDYVQMFARAWRPRGIVLVAAETIYTVTDPPLRALRRLIPPIRFGGVAVDLAWMVLFFLVVVLMNAI